MSTIRTFPPPIAPSTGRDTARALPAPAIRAAQQAFFKTAMETGPQPASPSTTTRRVEPQPADRLPRPGSLLDIRV